MEEDKITKALKRLVDGSEIRVIIRGGKICKIPAQTIKLQEKDGIITGHDIPADITE